jgi:hypothetical protein
MTLQIASKNDLGRVTRWLVDHPEVMYKSKAGDGGTILIEVDETTLA